jgi:hypothetical protein
MPMLGKTVTCSRNGWQSECIVKMVALLCLDLSLHRKAQECFNLTRLAVEL